MKIELSQSFMNAVKRLSGKSLDSIREMYENVAKAESVGGIANCKKLINFKHTYRIRIGDLRAFFILYLVADGNIVHFEYLKHRGEAYKKGMLERLRDKDRQK
ncbi:MAG TPA: hypothetical protein DDW85_07620 [Porphyromonadaceae bacterium]|jgi:mRNA-degrading endonuclease RelE of RelBE toxin-antitoxin system|nr:hypothetical protein [Porphyromonadaceae bacterium]